MDAAICPPSAEPGPAGAVDGSSSLVRFGQEHFGRCALGDKRLTARAVSAADALMRHPGGTLPAKLPRAQLCGFYDFANNVKVNHDNVLACHRRRTREHMCRCPGTVLVVHATRPRVTTAGWTSPASARSATAAATAGC
jgi:hypothetical protein